MKIRNLDGIYCRVERNGAFENRCLTDLRGNELDEFLSKLNSKGLANTLEHLNNQILSVSRDCLEEDELRTVVKQVVLLLRYIGEQCNIVAVKLAVN